MTARQLRAARGVVASTLTTLLAATAHTLAGAGAPSPWLVAIAAIVAAPLGVVLVGRGPSPVRTVAVVAAAQLVFHGAFMLFADPSAVVYSPMAGHAAMHAAPVMTMAAGGSGHAMSTAMVATHALAALVTVALLLHGERMLQALGRGIRSLLPVPCAAVPRPIRARRVGGVFAHVVPIARRLAAVVPRRGPPVVA